MKERDRIICKSPAMQKVMEQVNRVASSQISILFCGENGTGKNLLARYTHDFSLRKDGPFVILDCATISPNLVESELFGYERGAFTGATATKTGLIDKAKGGTLFLNEIQNLSLEIQAKLLEVLDSQIFRRVGGTQDLQADFRLMSATNQDIAQLIAVGRFRQDLYFRINELCIEFPTLRERWEDILPLAEHFVEQFNLEEGKNVKLSRTVKRLLLAHTWPGNVRELRNVIHRAVILCQTPELRPKDFPLDSRLAMQLEQAKQERWSLEEIERQHIVAILEVTGGNLTQTSQILGIDRKTLLRKIKKYKL
jgi:DNA-binding NtrC family response regulator